MNNSAAVGLSTEKKKSLNSRLRLLKLDEVYASETLKVVTDLLARRQENIEALRNKTQSTLIISEVRDISDEIDFLESRKNSLDIKLGQLKKSIRDVEINMKLADNQIKKEMRGCVKVLQNKKE